MKIIPRSTPVGGPLVRGLLARAPDALPFYPAGHPADLDGYVRRARAVDEAFTRERRQRIVAGLRGGGIAGDARRVAFVEEGGYVVTTGQQPGLFGGPLYSVYKALTAAALAERLEAHLGRPVLPIFWVAGEDHDWEEVRTVTLADVSNELREIEVAIPDGADGGPIHRAPLGVALDEARSELLGGLPPSEFMPALSETLARCYTEGMTLAQGFARWMEALLAPAGVMILEPEQEPWIQDRLPQLLNLARQADVLAEATTARHDSLTEAGFAPQVPALKGGVLLFCEVDGRRERLYFERGADPAAGGTGGASGAGGAGGEDGEDGLRFRTRVGDHRWSLADLEAVATADPARLSPNVLSRPVIEAALLPTLAYVGGPAEMAYLGQTGPIFEALGVVPPVAHPRLSATVLERRVERVLERFGLEVVDLAMPHDQLAASLMRTDLPEPVQDALTDLRGALDGPLGALRLAVADVDPTLKGPVDSLLGQFLHGVGDLERKIVQARKRQAETALRQLEKAQIQLFPGGKPQERVFPAVYYLARYGDDVMEAWMEAARASVQLP
jgi:bacillithiol synthase